MKNEMTRAIAWAAATDAANRNKNKAGRYAWNEEDKAVAIETYYRLWPEENGQPTRATERK